MSWSTALTEIFKFLNNIFVTPKRQIEKVVNIYDEMHRLLETTDVERLLILKAHNGGGVIKPSGDLYASVLYEDYRHPFTTVKPAYQKLPVDSEYARMLVDIIQNKKTAFDTDTLRNSVLKGLYELEGVESSVVIYLGQDKKSVYYVSFASSRKLIHWYNNLTAAALDISANIIKQNLK